MSTGERNENKRKFEETEDENNNHSEAKCPRLSSSTEICTEGTCTSSTGLNQADSRQENLPFILPDSTWNTNLHNTPPDDSTYWALADQLYEVGSDDGGDENNERNFSGNSEDNLSNSIEYSDGNSDVESREDGSDEEEKDSDDDGYDGDDEDSDYDVYDDDNDDDDGEIGGVLYFYWSLYDHEE